MSVSQIDKIDLITKKENGDYVLIIEADEPWKNTNKFKYNLQEKLNNYCIYFRDGQMIEDYPDLKQKSIPVRIYSLFKIPEQMEGFLHELFMAFSKHGLDIEIVFIK